VAGVVQAAAPYLGVYGAGDDGVGQGGPERDGGAAGGVREAWVRSGVVPSSEHGRGEAPVVRAISGGGRGSERSAVGGQGSSCRTRVSHSDRVMKRGTG